MASQPATLPPSLPTGPSEAPGRSEHDERGDEAPPVGFWQQPWAQNVLPFLTSLAVHAAIVVLAVVLIQVTRVIIRQVKAQEQTVVPEVALSDGDPGGPPYASMNNNPFLKPLQDARPDEGQPDAWHTMPGALRRWPRKGRPARATPPA